VRRRRRHHRGPQPRADDRSRGIGPLRPRSRHPRGLRRHRREPDHRLQVRDEAKLHALAEELGVTVDGRDKLEIAKDVAEAMMEDFGTRKDAIGMLDRVPEVRRELWRQLGITPRGIDRENVEMLHRTHMGVDNDYVNILLHALRTSLSDGWGGSLVATELSDVMFGTPQPVLSKVNLGVLDEAKVNIALHGHNPLLSDVIVQAAQDEELVALAREKGAAGINLVGLCCTGNELQMRGASRWRATT
jgi:anaerobic carbon-monoxide dehydrogenase catalytic subunit